MADWERLEDEFALGHRSLADFGLDTPKDAHTPDSEAEESSEEESTTSTPLSVATASPGALQLEEKRKVLRRLLRRLPASTSAEAPDAALIRQLAISQGGLLEDVFRRRLWPLLASSHPGGAAAEGLPSGGDSASSSSDGYFSTTESLARDEASEEETQAEEREAEAEPSEHRDWRQVEMDVKRTLSRFPPNIDEAKRLQLQDRLTPLICRLLGSHPDYAYYQGFHDILLTLLVVTDSEDSSLEMARKLCSLDLFPFLTKPIEDVDDALQLIYVILYQVDGELEAYLRRAELGTTFALSWYITWFAHAIDDYAWVTRLYDLFLASHPLMPVYLSAHLLTQEAYTESEEAEKARTGASKMKKFKRWTAIGVAGAVGGTLIGLTGGLAAPLVATGAGVLIGGGVAAGIATATGAAVLGSLFGVAGAGLAGYKMQKRVGAVEEFVVETMTDGQALHVAICVSGWIEEDREDSFKWAWRHLAMSKEQYSLRFETAYMVQLGKAMDYFTSIALTAAVQATLMETALATLVSAVAWPMAVVSAASVIDNPWNTCMRRAQEVGQYLAEMLLSRQQGQRPVTLLGYSLGARVIFHCLFEMAKRPHNQGIVQDVFLLGAPITGSRSQWKTIASVVGGRIINGYSQRDLLLKFLYRTMNAQMSIAGIGPVEGTGEQKIKNVDLSEIIGGHLDYRGKLREVLQAVGVRTHHRASEEMSKATSFSSLLEARKSKTASLPQSPLADQPPKEPID